MSENLNRSNPDFSKYDSMSIGELEEILRADAQGSERDDSDVDEILYVMEVLAKKRRENGTAGKTALEAYQEFQQHYLHMVEEKSAPRQKTNIIPFRRIAAVAACLVLMFSLTTTANAFSFRDMWDAVVTWAQETFSFSIGVEVSEPTPSDTLQYSSLQAVIDEARVNVVLPSRIPDGYTLSEIIIDESPKQEVYIGIFTNNDKMIKITVQSFLLCRPSQFEKSDELVEVYSQSDIDYYIFCNQNQCQVVWNTQGYECMISGELSIDEIRHMIDSIKGG